jgi:signal transduction histidine kinase
MYVEVADDGIGIDPSLLPDIFEPFSAAGGEVALHMSGRFELGSRGLGLGLALAKAAVEAHGGRLEVESDRGKGSCFRIVLPRR